jgi:cold shock CspA family protein
MTSAESKLTRIGVFYDGNFFFHVSNYYTYHHARRARISVAGLHDFIRHEVSVGEASDIRYCQIVDAHYFRGRPSADQADQRGILRAERAFDDVLVREGIVTHYLPLRAGGEMGIDVWLALEAYELAIYKRFDVSVLIAGDGDFLPLVRKLNTLGTRVMLLAWDFKFMDANQREQETRTNQILLDEVTYPVMMHQVIDDRSRRDEPFVKNLFLPKPQASAQLPQPVPLLSTARSASLSSISPETSSASVPTPATSDGTIKVLKDGYGFIEPASGEPNMFFFHASVTNADFNELILGSRVRYAIGQNDRGACAVAVEVQGAPAQQGVEVDADSLRR